MPSWYGYEKKEYKNPNLSTDAQRKYVRAIAEALNIKLERKLMKQDYCRAFITDHKFDYITYLNENNIVPPPTQKQKKYIEKMKRVLCHYYKDSEIYTEVSNIEEAKEFIEKWKSIYSSLLSNYYNSIAQIDYNDPWR